jgi:hypothetical protein
VEAEDVPPPPAQPERWPVPRVALAVALISICLWAVIIAIVRWLFR